MTDYDEHYSKQTYSYRDDNGNLFHLTEIKMPSTNYTQIYVQDSEWKDVGWSDSNKNIELFRYKEIGKRKNGEIIYESIVILSTIRFIYDEVQYSRDDFLRLYHDIGNNGKLYPDLTKKA